MYELNSQLIIGWLILSSIMFVTALILNGFKYARSFCWRGLAGISAILAADYLLSGYGLFIGINFFTAFVAGLLGIPGVAMLYCLNYFIV